MADEQAKSDEQQKQRMPLRDQSGSPRKGDKNGIDEGGAGESAGDSPMDPEDAAFIKQNK